jgi:thioredoxin:protein disulfide reductase
MKRKQSFIVIMYVLFFAVFSFVASANPFSWSLTEPYAATDNGDGLGVDMHLSAGSGSYVYQSSISARFNDARITLSGKPVFKNMRNHFDSLTKEEESVLVNGSGLTVPFNVASDTIPENVKMFLTYQGCIKNVCYLPVTDTFMIKINTDNRVFNHSAGIKQSHGNTTAGSFKQAGNGVMSKGALMAVLLAFLGGLLTCLTPCVYPLIPITISIFGTAGAKSRAGAFGFSSLYVAGISVMFTFLGFIVTMTGKVFGQFMSNPFVIGFIAVVFCAFGASLMGAFNIQFPSSFQNGIASITGKSSGKFKVFFMGLVAGIIAAPCTGPSLGAILAYIAASGGKWSGIFLLFSFSLGLGLPFLVLGTFSNLIAARPKPGPWMNLVKSILGIAMFVTALYFLHNIFPLVGVLAAATPFQYSIMALITIAGVFIGMINLSGSKRTIYVLRKTIGSILVTAGIFGLTGGFLLTGSAKKIHAQESEALWITDVYKGVDSGHVSKRPVIIDFYADWCAACRELDSKTFSDTEVKKELSKFVCVRCNFTKETPAAHKLAAEYSIRGLPVIEFYSASGERLVDKRITGFVDAKTMLARLRSVE